MGRHSRAFSSASPPLAGGVGRGANNLASATSESSPRRPPRRGGLLRNRPPQRPHHVPLEPRRHFGRGGRERLGLPLGERPASSPDTSGRRFRGAPSISSPRTLACSKSPRPAPMPSSEDAPLFLRVELRRGPGGPAVEVHPQVGTGAPHRSRTRRAAFRPEAAKGAAILPPRPRRSARGAPSPMRMHGGEHVELAREERVDGAQREPGGVGDVLDLRAVEALRREDTLGRFEDQPAIGRLARFDRGRLPFLLLRRPHVRTSSTRDRVSDPLTERAHRYFELTSSSSYAIRFRTGAK